MISEKCFAIGFSFRCLCLYFGIKTDCLTGASKDKTPMLDEKATYFNLQNNHDCSLNTVAISLVVISTHSN